MEISEEKRKEITSHYTEEEFARVLKLVDKYEVLRFMMNVYRDFPMLIKYINHLEEWRQIASVLIIAIISMEGFESKSLKEVFKENCEKEKCETCDSKEDCIIRSIEKAMSDNHEA